MKWSLRSAHRCTARVKQDKAADRFCYTMKICVCSTVEVSLVLICIVQIPFCWYAVCAGLIHSNYNSSQVSTVPDLMLWWVIIQRCIILALWLLLFPKDCLSVSCFLISNKPICLNEADLITCCCVVADEKVVTDQYIYRWFFSVMDIIKWNISLCATFRQRSASLVCSWFIFCFVLFTSVDIVSSRGLMWKPVTALSDVWIQSLLMCRTSWCCTLTVSVIAFMFGVHCRHF